MLLITASVVWRPQTLPRPASAVFILLTVGYYCSDCVCMPCMIFCKGLDWGIVARATTSFPEQFEQWN